MKCLTVPETKEWLSFKAIQSEDNEFANVSSMDSFGIVIPKRAFQKQEISRILFELAGEWSEVVVWVFDWPFYRKEEMAIIGEIRKANQETRELIEARVHVFSKDEKELAIGFVAMLLFYEWDFKMIPYPLSSAILSYSHHDRMEINYKDKAIGEQVKARFKEIEVEISD